MAQLRIDFQGRGKVQTFPRARVQAMRDSVQLALRVARQVCALGQILAQQPIRILVGATLPGAIRIGKEDPDRQPLRQALVLGHLFPSIIGQRITQLRGYVPEFLGEALTGTPRIRSIHPGQNDQARHPFHQGANGRPRAGSLDEVTFPVAWHGAGGHLGGALGKGVMLGIWPRRSVPRARGRRALRA